MYSERLLDDIDRRLKRVESLLKSDGHATLAEALQARIRWELTDAGHATNVRLDGFMSMLEIRLRAIEDRLPRK